MTSTAKPCRPPDKSPRKCQACLRTSVRYVSGLYIKPEEDGARVSPDDYDAVFYPGGHGPLWDLAEDKDSIALIQSLYQADKPVAFVCHAPGVLRHVKAADGTPLVHGRQVTGFKNSEEDGVGLTQVVPFLVEDMLKENGGIYSSGDDWSSYAVQDGLLITGQNPGSSVQTAGILLSAVAAAKAA
ncbi:type 1 glutamine amidotransferase domain-containing protein [Rhizobium leguminosarum]|uniref:type 1 glutamine amidotransferase domain-containing protein n=1 Tax=Rhizobium leguminosarum TaxID=384 RepID=UPI002484D52E|nr:type 1 glutamine amidotransferase domain-containing protein [Rhizobium leguminosarum]